jgi:cytochrome P450
MSSYQQDTAKHFPAASIGTQVWSPPGPPPFFIGGYMREQMKFNRDRIKYLMQLYQNHGVLSAWGGAEPLVVFSFAPNLNERLFSDPELFHWAPRARPQTKKTPVDLLSASIVRLNGEPYKRRRDMIRPPFRNEAVEHWRSKMVSVAGRILSLWKPNETRDVYEEMRRIVIAVSMETVFGISSPAVIDRIDGLLRRNYAATVSVATMFFPVNIPGTTYYKMMSTGAELVEFLREQVRGELDPESMMAMVQAARDANGDGLSENELIAEAFNLMNHDTTISALTWTLFLLAQHPEEHAAVVDELGALGGNPPATVEQVERLPLLDFVIKESLRLLPPFGAGRRFTSRPCEFGPLHLAAGRRIIFSPYVTHRLPEIYSQPQRFMPRRWETLRPTPYQYMPFGAGAHFCLGRRFALLEIKTVLAMVLQRFRLAVAPGARIDRTYRLSLEPLEGMPMVVSKQDRRFTRNEIRGNIHEMIDF